MGGVVIAGCDLLAAPDGNCAVWVHHGRDATTAGGVIWPSSPRSWNWRLRRAH